MTAIRTETLLWWTGAGWSEDSDRARVFANLGDAQEAIKTVVTPPPTGETVNIVAVAGAN